MYCRRCSWPEGIFTYYEQIGELENKLQDKGFFRCHKSYLINLKYVDGYNRQEVILENGKKIVIAKRRYDKFCKKFLGASQRREGLFGNILGRLSFISYTFSVLRHPIFFMGLVLLLFRSDREKRILAASMLMVVVRIVADFAASFLSCLELFFLHVVKKIPEPFFKEWVIGLISGAGYCFAILAVRRMSKHLDPVFCGKPRRGMSYWQFLCW